MSDAEVSDISNFSVVACENAPAMWGGVYFGPSVVLCRTPSHVLIWVRGQNVFSGTGQPWTYARAHLMYVPRFEADRYKRLGAGGPLTKAIRIYADEIDGCMGEGFSRLLVPGKTLVIGTCEPLARQEGY